MQILHGPVRSKCARFWGRATASCLIALSSDFVFEIFMDKLCIAIGAFDKRCLARDRQPHTRMAERAVAAIAGHAPCVDDAGFGGLCHHLGSILCWHSVLRDYI